MGRVVSHLVDLPIVFLLPDVDPTMDGARWKCFIAFYGEPIIRAIEKKSEPGVKTAWKNGARGENYTVLGWELCRPTFWSFFIEIFISDPGRNSSLHHLVSPAKNIKSLRTS